MTIRIPESLGREDFAAELVRRYLEVDRVTGQARYSGAYFERLGGGGDRNEIAWEFTAEDLLAVTMLSVRIEGHHALHVLDYRARELNSLLAQIPPNVDLRDDEAGPLIAPDGAAWKLWTAICDIRPRTEDNRIGPVAAGKLLARKRPRLIPVYDSRVKEVLRRPRADTFWWHDLRTLLISEPGFVALLENVRRHADAGHMSLLRVFDVMCWMYSRGDDSA